MGSCISTCRPKPSLPEESNLVQDKLVISQVSSFSKHLPNKPLPSSSSSSSSSSTSSSSSSTTTTTTATTSSSSKAAFSDEFLWSCIKENVHILPTDPIKLSPVKPVRIRHPLPKSQTLKKPKAISTTPKQPIPNSARPKQLINTRSNSPSLGRQRSFRKDQDPVSVPKRTPSSPTTSRRFTGDSNVSLQKHPPRQRCRREAGNGTGVPRSVPTTKEALQPLKSCELRRQSSCLKRETFVHEVPSQEDEKVVEDFLSQHDLNSSPVEDLNNPLISLDCFIFL